MDLPNYYFADLPDASALTAKLVTESCQSLMENRTRFLLSHSTQSLISIIASLARDWLDPEFPFREMALERGPAETGFSRPTLQSGLDRFFRQLTQPNLEALVTQDLGSLRRLDEIVSTEIELKGNRASFARGPELLVHITAGVLPNPALTSIVLGLLIRSAQFVKCARGTSFLPRMFAHSLYAIHPKIASCLEIAEWQGGNETLETALFAHAHCLTATGSDETLASIRQRLPIKSRFIGYGHKISCSYIAREALVRYRRAELVASVAEDILAWNQLGCLSPHVVYVENGGGIPPAEFAEFLAGELANREQDEPRGELAPQDAAAITTRRMVYQVRAAEGEHTKLWTSQNSTAWTVVYEEDPTFHLSCLNRFIYVKQLAGLDQLMISIAHLQGSVSTVALAAPGARFSEIALALARWGVSRVCPAGQMQNPPLTWRHDGRPALADLITWTDLELP